MKLLGSLGQTYRSQYLLSSIVLGFLNPTLQLQHTDITTFCMLENSEDGKQHCGERGCYLGLGEGEGRWKNGHFSGIVLLLYSSLRINLDPEGDLVFLKSC